MNWKKKGLLPKGKHGVKHVICVCARETGADKDTVCLINMSDLQLTR